uniref:non-structural maintenance of chromosomes element 3 homolog n=1 Tax=Pristiophorus japonicus TaxID=55135 RepID=UPI00398E5213
MATNSTAYSVTCSRRLEREPLLAVATAPQKRVTSARRGAPSCAGRGLTSARRGAPSCAGRGLTSARRGRNVSAHKRGARQRESEQPEEKVRERSRSLQMPRARNSAAHSSGHRSSQAGTSQQQQQQDSDADDVGPSQTPTGSQSQHSPDKLTPAAVDRKVSEVVQYILIMEQRKVPVKRKDIIKNVLKDYRSRYTEIMKRTTRTFHQ